MRYTKLIIAFVGIWSMSCRSAMNVKGNVMAHEDPLASDESVVVFNEIAKLPDSLKTKKLGEFKIRDGGLSVDCGYATVLKIAKDKARSVGGNVIKITRHMLPGFSTCDQIDFEVYKIADVTPYEKEILWSERRDIKWEDFKDAPKVNLPFYSCLYIDAYFDFTKFLSSKGRFVVNPEFNTGCSWVQPDYKTKGGIELVNVHFDLTEIYAVRMRKEFAENGLNDFRNWQKFASEIYKRINKEYETEVYNLYNESAYGANEAELIAWKFKVSEDLKKILNK